MFIYILTITENAEGIIYMYPSGNGFFVEPVLAYNVGTDNNPSWRRITDFTIIPAILMKVAGTYSEKGDMVEVRHSKQFIEYVLKMEGWKDPRQR